MGVPRQGGVADVSPLEAHLRQETPVCLALHGEVMGLTPDPGLRDGLEVLGHVRAQYQLDDLGPEGLPVLLPEPLQQTAGLVVLEGLEASGGVHILQHLGVVVHEGEGVVGADAEGVVPAEVLEVVAEGSQNKGPSLQRPLVLGQPQVVREPAASMAHLRCVDGIVVGIRVVVRVDTMQEPGAGVYAALQDAATQRSQSRQTIRWQHRMPALLVNIEHAQAEGLHVLPDGLKRRHHGGVGHHRLEI
mmetsp:Transcript_100968/g.324149  ORF Transcript_100968/g.324149 Transcript_100968/m.324149 type:complete len:246 (-) Transcript_100968:2025-2762(-)